MVFYRRKSPKISGSRQKSPKSQKIILLGGVLIATRVGPAGTEESREGGRGSPEERFPGRFLQFSTIFIDFWRFRRLSRAFWYHRHGVLGSSKVGPRMRGGSFPGNRFSAISAIFGDFWRFLAIFGDFQGV